VAHCTYLFLSFYIFYYSNPAVYDLDEARFPSDLSSCQHLYTRLIHQWYTYNRSIIWLFYLCFTIYKLPHPTKRSHETQEWRRGEKVKRIIAECCTFPYYNWTRAEYPLTNVHPFLHGAIFRHSLVQLGALVPLSLCFIIISRTRWNVKRCWGCASETRPIIVTALEDMENSISLVLRRSLKQKKRWRQRGKRGTHTRRHLLHQTFEHLDTLSHPPKNKTKYERVSHPGCAGVKQRHTHTHTSFLMIMKRKFLYSFG
jgi:hypothetical protein